MGRATPKEKFNNEPQFYKGIEVRLIYRGDYHVKQAIRFTLNGTNQNVWIPKKHLEVDGTIKSTENIDYIFRRAQKQLMLAGYDQPIPGIKRRTEPLERLTKKGETHDNPKV